MILNGRSIQGFEIYGGLDRLEELRKIYPLHGILVAISAISESEMALICKVASDANLKVYRWRAELTTQDITG